MKKLLLSMLGLAVMTAAQAGSYTIVFKSGSSTSDGSSAFAANAAVANVIESGAGYVASIGATNNVYSGKQGYGIKFSSSKASGAITLNLADEARVNVTSIVVNAAPWQSTATNNPIDAAELSVKVNDGDAVTKALDNTSADFADYIWDYASPVSAQSITFTANKRLYIKSVTVNYEGAGITEPDEPEPAGNTKVASIAEFLAANAAIESGKESTDKFEFTCTLTAVYQSVYNDGIGNSMYVTDGHDNLLVYNTLSNKYENGDIIPAGVAGTFKNYGGLPELMVDASTVKAAAGKTTPIEPAVVSVNDIDAGNVAKSAYVQVKGVSISGISGKNFTVTDAQGKTVAGYNSLNVTPAEGTSLIITGFVNYYNKYQISPIEIKADDSGVDSVAADVNTPAEYYNMLGVRVANPAPGLYIKRQGGKTVKVLVK